MYMSPRIQKILSMVPVGLFPKFGFTFFSVCLFLMFLSFSVTPSHYSPFMELAFMQDRGITTSYTDASGKIKMYTIRSKDLSTSWTWRDSSKENHEMQDNDQVLPIHVTP